MPLAYKKRNKKRSYSKGLSTIVATLLIILLTLVAVGIIWIVVRNVIQNGAEQVSLGKFTLNLEIKNVQKISDTQLNVKLKRNAGEGEISGLEFIVDDGENSEVVKITNLSFNELEERTFNLVLVSGINLSKIQKVSVAPIFKLSSGKETVGDVKDEYIISATSTGSTGGTCTPYCPTGAVCGSDGCSGTCGSCNSSAPNCNNYQCSANVCTPSCSGKQCGSDGCSGTCGNCLLANAVSSCSASYQCVISSCNSGYANCDLNITNGCETGLGTTTNCASCGNACSTGQICSSGVCTTSSTCGNGTCSNGETCSSCPSDCGCLTGYTCTSGNCVANTNGSLTCTDNDGDGYFSEGGDCGAKDCNDNSATINPGATEICGNSIDEDCDLSGKACGSVIT
jgi:hypothetical protein